jgi:DNA-binding CsgD family transcriptional regulator
MTKIATGRDTEMAEVERFLEAVAQGGAALVIEGDAGIGKTTVWRAGVAEAEERGYRVLTAQPTQNERDVSYASVADLLRGVLDEARAGLPGPQQRGLDAALLRGMADEPADPRTIATGLASLLTALAELSSVLVTIDDAQWLDTASAAAIVLALRRVGDEPIGVLVTRRPGNALGQLLADARLVHLGPLSLAAIHHIVTAALGRSLPRALLTQVHATSGGNPFFAIELARFVLDGDGPSSPGNPILRLPESIASLVTHRLARLPAPSRKALLIAASLASPTNALIESVLGEPAAAALDRAAAAGVIEINSGRVRFTHPLLSSAAYHSASEESRRRLHGRLAGLVDDLEERAHHLALGSSPEDEAVAATLDAAAARALTRGAPEAAAELRERAAALTPGLDADGAHRRLINAAEDFFKAGDRARARVLAEKVLGEVPDGVERGNALRLLGEIRYSEASFPDAIRALQDALRYVNEPQVTIQIRLDLAFAFCRTGDLSAALASAATALADAEQLQDQGLLAGALAVSTMVGFLAGRGTDREKLEQALALEDIERPGQMLLRPRAIAAMISVYEGRLTEAREGLHGLRAWAIEYGAESELPFLLHHLAWVEWWRGDFREAIRVAEEALALAAQADSATNRIARLVLRAMANSSLGDVAPARADLDEAAALVEQTGDAFGFYIVRLTLGSLELALGDAAAAESALAALIDAVAAKGVREPTFSGFVPDAVEALVQLGELERADALLTTFESRSHELERAWTISASARCRSLLLAEQGDLSGALAAAEQALIGQEDLELPLELGRAFLVLGRIRRRRKEKRLAKAALEEALRIFDSIGARPWAVQARAELRRVGSRRDPDELTETERRVAELVATGMTNRDVALAAFVTPKTVEATLERIYVKLGISSRAELGARMGARPGSSSRPSTEAASRRRTAG